MSKNSELYTRASARKEINTAPSRVVTLLYEARWLALSVAAMFLFLIFATYSKLDPGWSHSSAVKSYMNWGGPVGAWLADLMLFSFGLSAWWFFVLAARAVWSSYPRLWQKLAKLEQEEQLSQLPVELAIQSVGFVMLVLGSTGLEYVRMYSLKAQLPRCPGGVIGQLAGGGSQQYLGFTGGTLLLVLLIAVGSSLFFHLSWLNFVEFVGAIIETIWSKLTGILRDIQDRRVGQEAALVREQFVQEKSTHTVNDAPMTNLSLKVEPSFESSLASEIAARPSATPDSVIAPIQAPGASSSHPDVVGTPAAQTTAVKVDIPRVAMITPVTTKTMGGAEEPMDDRYHDVESDIEVLTDVIPTPLSVFVKPVAQGEILVAPPIVQVTPPVKTLKDTVRGFFSAEQLPELPPLSLLDPATAEMETVSVESLDFTSRLIEKKLKDFGVDVRVVGAYPGPVVTRYEIEPATGVKGSQIVGLSRDLARALSITSIRVVETIPGKNCMGLELPNQKRQIVRLTEIIGSQLFHDNASSVSVALGKDIAGNAVVADLAKMPHLLVAGTTGSGKSVGINATILSLLYKATADDVRLILIDPKMLELSIYEGIPHLLAPVVTDMRQAAHALNWAVAEMERRYKLMSKLGVRNLAGFNAKILEAQEKEMLIPNPFSLTPDSPEPLTKLPTIVIVIDELADLMMVVGKKVEELIARIAQKARAAGVHLILATQRPSVDVITGLIKANIPTRIAFQVSSKIDSRTILDQMGAESLLGMGDMLYMPPGTGMPQRVHGAFVSDDEVHRVVDFLKQHGEPNYIEGILEGGVGEGGVEGVPGTEPAAGENDPLYDQAVQIVLKQRRASISLVQRNLRIGYNRSARILEQMEQSGIVSAMQSNGNRDILVPAGNE